MNSTLPSQKRNQSRALYQQVMSLVCTSNVNLLAAEPLELNIGRENENYYVVRMMLLHVLETLYIHLKFISSIYILELTTSGSIRCPKKTFVRTIVICLIIKKFLSIQPEATWLLHLLTSPLKYSVSR